MLKAISWKSSNFGQAVIRNENFVLTALAVTVLTSTIFLGLTFYPDSFLPSSLAPLFGTIAILSLMDVIFLACRSRFVSYVNVSSDFTREEVIEKLLNNFKNFKYFGDHRDCDDHKILTEAQERAILDKFKKPDSELDALLSYSPHIQTIDFLARNRRFFEMPNHIKFATNSSSETCTPLIHAIRKQRNPQLIEKLWEISNPSTRDLQGNSALYYLITKDPSQLSIPSFLQNHPNRSTVVAELLCHCMVKGLIEIVKFLLAHDADLQLPVYFKLSLLQKISAVDLAEYTVKSSSSLPSAKGAALIVWNKSLRDRLGLTAHI